MIRLVLLGFYRVFQGFRVLWVSVGFIRFCLVITGFNRILLGFRWFYWFFFGIRWGLTGFNWMPLDGTEFAGGWEVGN